MNANKFTPFVPSSKEIISETIVAPITPKIMYSTISINFLYFPFLFLIKISIKIDDGMPNTVTIGTIYINPKTKPAIKLLKVICSYEVSKVATATTKLPHREEIRTDMIFLT
ncbi:hypothetical protein F6Y02_37180 (plasmid) [Bacillus megaterium]|nr:hypothetical protein [Priestia megaterium]